MTYSVLLLRDCDHLPLSVPKIQAFSPLFVATDGVDRLKEKFSEMSGNKNHAVVSDENLKIHIAVELHTLGRIR